MIRFVHPLLLLSAIAAAPVLAAGNPCAMNPCANKTGLDSKLITRPAGYKPVAGDLNLGERLWKDTKLSTNGMSCNSCHANHGAFMASFAEPYPHQVAMAKEQTGMKAVHLDEMIQACMAIPMAAKPLPWESKELAALTAYTATLQKTFKPNVSAGMSPANPCSAKPANPCGKLANPCAK